MKEVLSAVWADAKKGRILLRLADDDKLCGLVRAPLGRVEKQNPDRPPAAKDASYGTAESPTRGAPKRTTRRRCSRVTVAWPRKCCGGNSASQACRS